MLELEGWWEVKTLKLYNSWLIILMLSLGLVACFGDDDDPADPDEDTTAPAAVGDLVVLEDQTTLTSVTLSWTAPGDDGNTGTAEAYDLRYTTRTAGRIDWEGATQVGGEPNPGAAGTQESFTVNGLNPVTEYSFALKTADEVPNWSAMSNTAIDTTMGGLLVAKGNGARYALVHTETGEDLAYVNHDLTATIEHALGFQGRKVLILAQGQNSFDAAIYSCDSFTGDNLIQISDDLAMEASALDGNPKTPVVAFAASPTFNGWDNIYTVSENGGAVTQLTEADQQFALGRLTVRILEANQPCWSPDGSRIAFRCAVREVGTDELYRHDTICVMDADGGNLTPIYWRQQIETAVFRTPCWTADGSYVAFIEDNPTYENGVVFVSMDTGNTYNLWNTIDINDTKPRALAMDPWHMRMAVYYEFAGWDDIWLTDLTTIGDAISASTPVELTDNGAVAHQYDDPDWAPWSPQFD